MAINSDFHNQADDVLVINSYDEKRAYPRQDVSINGKLKIGDTVLSIEMRDLSRSGARIQLLSTNNDFSAGQNVELILTWPLAINSDMLHVNAEIVRIQNHELGVRFTHIDQDNRLH